MFDICVVWVSLNPINVVKIMVSLPTRHLVFKMCDERNENPASYIAIELPIVVRFGEELCESCAENHQKVMNVNRQFSRILLFIFWISTSLATVGRSLFSSWISTIIISNMLHYAHSLRYPINFCKADVEFQQVNSFGVREILLPSTFYSWQDCQLLHIILNRSYCVRVRRSSLCLCWMRTDSSTLLPNMALLPAILHAAAASSIYVEAQITRLKWWLTFAGNTRSRKEKISH